ncbi:hypothetical protein [Robiginitalea sp.]|jgi:hypothetical protein
MTWVSRKDSLGFDRESVCSYLSVFSTKIQTISVRVSLRSYVEDVRQEGE